jgi:hypothetical protein
MVQLPVKVIAFLSIMFNQGFVQIFYVFHLNFVLSVDWQNLYAEVNIKIYGYNRKE